jgi:hypothetical protein
MITITDTITIAVITIAIIIFRSGPYVHTYSHNLSEASSRFCWKI